MRDLFKKELWSEKNWLIGLSCYVLAVNLLFLPLAKHTDGTFAILALVFTLPAFSLLVLIKSFLLYKNEWDMNTGLLLFSLPVHRYKIVLAKLGAITVEVLLYTFLALLIPYIILNWYSKGLYGAETPTLIKLWLLGSLGTFLLIPFPTFAYIFSRVFVRFRGWIMTVSLIIILIIFFKYIAFGRVIFGFLPSVSFNFIICGGINSVTASTETLAATFLFDLLLLWGSSYFLEKAEM